MQARLSPHHENDPRAQEAASLLRACVHCGFCTATCPTYQELGDERDSPRGRLHLVMQLLEGNDAGAATQQHLDRCLTCRSCETACPSGVQYARIVETGKHLLLESRPRPWWPRQLRRLMVTALTSRPLQWAGVLRRELHGAFAAKVAVPAITTVPATRRVLWLQGCVQPLLDPGIDAAAQRVLAAVGVELVAVRGAECCGAIRQHTDDPEGALVQARRNIDAWWPQLSQGASAVLSTASGCSLMLTEYGRLLQHDPQYAERAARISALAVDLVDLLPAQWPAALRQRLAALPSEALVYHPPCTQQHGLRVQGRVETLLQTAGAHLLPFAERVLCCGSAGTYSLLQPSLSRRLRERKLAALQASKPTCILSANIGCIRHLGGGTSTPVLHWIQWLDGRLQSQE
jgi:glycolate oxidase iron-sulfur subunit